MPSRTEGTDVLGHQLAAPWQTLAPGPGGDPVVVAGNGPVGQTIALLLARWGLSVVLLDGRDERDPIGSKAICQARDVLDVWESVGAGRILAEEGVTWTTARTFYRDREISTWSFVDRGHSPFPPFVNISQARTEEVLDARIAACPLIEVRWGHEVVGFVPADDGVGVQVRTAQGERIVRGSYVAVCTGARSDALRAALGLGFDGRSFDDAFLICDIRAELPGWEHERRFAFDPEWNPGRQVLIHACPDSTYRIDWQVPPGFDLAAEESQGGLDRRIRQIIGDRPYEIVWRSVYRFHSRCTERMRLGRILLVGDSAHLVSPFGARGLNTGVFDAENAAWKIAYVAHGWASEDLLETYDVERMAATRENLEVTTATMDFLVPQSETERERRRAILETAAADPDQARTIDSGRFAEPFWYVDSPLTTLDPRRPFAGRPPKGQTPPPGPGIVLPDAPISMAGRRETRLRELVRSGVTVLTGAGVEPVNLGAVLADAIGGPLLVVPVADLDASLSVERGVRDELGVAADEAWVIRPDGYVAAVVPLAASSEGQAAVRGALEALAGRTVVTR